jgi:hypothetical protein
MGRIKIMGLATVAVLALGAMLASGASAAQDLLITEEGVLVSPGAGAFAEVGIGLYPMDNTFHEGATGEVVTNGKPKDVLTFAAAREWGCDSDYSGCPTGYSRSGGGIETVELTSKGKVIVKFSSKVELAEPSTPGPCVYEYAKTKLRSTFTIGLVVNFEALVAGKLNKTVSQSACPKTRSAVFLANFADVDFSGYLESELGP